MSEPWFKPTGEPIYEIIGANGAKRNMTLRDARKTGEYVSYSTIIKLIAKPQLNDWEKRQLLNLVMEYKSLTKLLALGNETTDWKDELINESKRINHDKYALQGKKIHSALEDYYSTEILSDDTKPYILSTIDTLNTFKSNNILKYETEKSFAHSMGFGGIVDLLIYTEDGLIIIDFKTKQGKELSRKDLYLDNLIQLACYRLAFKDQNVLFCGNQLISVTTPGKDYLHLWSDEELDRGEEMFCCLLRYWQLVNNYYPGEKNA